MSYVKDVFHKSINYPDRVVLTTLSGRETRLVRVTEKSRREDGSRVTKYGLFQADEFGFPLGDGVFLYATELVKLHDELDRLIKAGEIVDTLTAEQYEKACQEHDENEVRRQKKHTVPVAGVCMR